MNPTTFSNNTGAGRLAPPADAKNAAGGRAYAQVAEEALATAAATATFSDTYHVTADVQLAAFLELAKLCSDEYVAKCAVFARQHAKMKDTGVVLLAILAARKTPEARAAMAKAFPVVVDNGKMLRNYVQVVRSGVTGRKSLGYHGRRLIEQWFASRSTEEIFRQSIGDKPSMADVISLTHPRPATPGHRALFGELLGLVVDPRELPQNARDLAAWRAGEQIEAGLPRVPWEMLTSQPLNPDQWKAIARQATWTQLRMNLVNFGRHGCWLDAELVALVAAKLADPAEVRRSRCFPYQLMMAFKAAAETGPETYHRENHTDQSRTVPMPIMMALQDAMEVACEAIPALEGVVHVYPDVSGSMVSTPVTGSRPGQTSRVRCIDVAALVAAAVLRKNPSATVIPFDVSAHMRVDLNPRDSIMTNAKKLAGYGGGGTDCSAPIRAVLDGAIPLPDVAIFVSDNESWIEGRLPVGGIVPGYGYYQPGGSGPAAQRAWNAVLAQKPSAKLVCINLACESTVQAKGEGVLNVGGFSDSVFVLMAGFATGSLTQTSWLDTVQAVDLDAAGATFGIKSASATFASSTSISDDGAP